MCVRADATREQAIADGFEAADLDAASSADVVCVLVPDDAIPALPLQPRTDALVIVASGYTLAFDRFDPACDVGMVAPRMLGPEVRRCYEEGVGFITAVGVHRDATGRARARVARRRQGHRRPAPGCDRDDRDAGGGARPGRRAGAVAGAAQGQRVVRRRDARARHPARGDPHRAVPVGRGRAHLPAAADRGLRRADGAPLAGQPVRPALPHARVRRTSTSPPRCARSSTGIAGGRFADEWDAERDDGFAKFERLKEAAAGPDIAAFEQELRAQLGEGAIS